MQVTGNDDAARAIPRLVASFLHFLQLAKRDRRSLPDRSHAWYRRGGSVLHQFCTMVYSVHDTKWVVRHVDSSQDVRESGRRELEIGSKHRSLATGGGGYV